MGTQEKRLTVGLPRMHKEAGERRDFLPDLVRQLTELGVSVAVETGIGSGMGYEDADYTRVSERVRVVSHAEAYAQDALLVLRCPSTSSLEHLRRGAFLFSMLHFPTRPRRVQLLRELGVRAISLDSITDDDGERLVVNNRAVGWNGVEAAFQALEKTYPRFMDTTRPPIRVTVMGSGRIAKQAVEAATKYGDRQKAEAFDRRGLAGVEVLVAGRNLTGRWSWMRDRLLVTDLLVDATQRTQATQPVIPNDWIAWLPRHAVICDLVVDPYDPKAEPPTVRGIEGIPQGNLDQITFAPDDSGWTATIPDHVPTEHRRTVVSCYSWPGVHPEACMRLYGRQLRPLLEAYVRCHQAGEEPSPNGGFFERALWRGSLDAFTQNEPMHPAAGRGKNEGD